MRDGQSRQPLGRTLGAVLIVALLAACSSRPAPVYDRSSNPYRKAAPSSTRVERPSHYVVRKGDTLYSIAFRYGLDFRTLASWNDIPAPYTIFPDQHLSLTAPRGGRPGTTTAAATPQPKTTPAQPAAVPSARTPPASPPASKTPTRSSPPPASRPSTPTPSVRAGDWRWPASGALLSSFAGNDPGRKGIDIAGKAGDPVVAAADGEVVYSGVGLIGYGELIIIKHDQQFLSAYGHNRKRLVNEGERVRAGQRIAEMGSTGADRPKLHFEIRRDGKPVDPQRYLPKR